MVDFNGLNQFLNEWYSRMTERNTEIDSSFPDAVSKSASRLRIENWTTRKMFPYPNLGID